jgi:hypothetical protein
MSSPKYIDAASAATVVITLVLFVVAVFLKGFTHDLLLEAGVFLVSVKLILMAQKNNVAAPKLDQRLERMEKLLMELPGNVRRDSNAG